MTERVWCYWGILVLSLYQLRYAPDPWPGYVCGVACFAVGLVFPLLQQTRRSPSPLSQSSRSLGELPVTQQAEPTPSHAFTYHTASPMALKTAMPQDNITRVRVVIDTAFNGEVTLTVGDADDVDRLLQSSDLDVTTPGTYDISPTYTYTTLTPLYLYLVCNGSTQGAGRVVLD